MELEQREQLAASMYRPYTHTHTHTHIHIQLYTCIHTQIKELKMCRKHVATQKLKASYTSSLRPHTLVA